MSTSEEALAPQVEAVQGLGQVVFIMGAARSGSTLLGTLLGQAPGVFFAGELTDWPGRAGLPSVPRSIPFWDEVRHRVAVPETADQLKRAFDHPAGMLAPFRRHRLRADYERVTRQVLESAAAVASSPIVVDSSHYPRRVRALRRMLGPGRVCLIFMVRQPSAVARSFRATEDKSELGIQLYLFAVGVLSWLAYLSHPRGSRAMVSYEALVDDPVGVAGTALGTDLTGVDPSHLIPSPLFIGNRFARDPGPVSVRKPEPHPQAMSDRLTDLVQSPLWLAGLSARRRSIPFDRPARV